MADKLMRTMIVMSFFLILALFSGCGAKGTSLTKADNGKELTLKPGDVLTLTLDSNPTTGYSWQILKIDNAVLVQNGEAEYKSSAGSDGLVGAGGLQIFHFKAISAGKVSLGLGYMRPWESVPPIETFEVQIVVQR